MIRSKKKTCPYCGKEIWYTASKCRECYLAGSLFPHVKNKQEYQRLYKQYIIENNLEYKERQLEINRNWRKKNKEHIKLYRKSYRKKHIEHILLKNKERQLRLKGVKGSHTLQEWENLKKQFDYKCAVCGKTEQEIKRKWKNTNFDCLTKDHIVPINKGGTNDISNIRPTCVSCNSKRKDNKAYRIVLTCGTWDLLHAGHLNIFIKAKELGDYLIVGVSTDELIKSYKKLKPIVNFKDRVRMIEALKIVDKVVPQTTLIDIEQFKNLGANIYVIGSDWKNRTDNEGLNWLRENNKVVFIPYTKRLSSSKIKERIIRNAIPIIKAQSRRGS